MPASGQLFMCGPLSVEYMTIVSSAMPSSSRVFSRSPTMSSWSSIVSWYSDCHRPGPADALRLRMRAEVHVRGVEPDEERRLGLVLALDEVDCGVAEFVVAGLHPLLGQRAGVLDALGAVAVGPGVQHAARAELLAELRVLRVVDVLRLLLGVEVVEVAEELVETVHAWAGTRRGRRGGSCRTGRSRNPAPSARSRWSGPRPAAPASRRACRPWSGRCGTGSGR